MLKLEYMCIYIYIGLLVYNLYRFLMFFELILIGKLKMYK